MRGARSRGLSAPARRTGRAMAALLVVAGTLVGTGRAGPAAGSIPSPLAGGWQLNGAALLVKNTTPQTLRLTPATNWKAGSAFWPAAVPGAGISATFDAFIGSGSGAEGLTFTLADASTTQPTALGAAGGGEGFAGIDGIAVSLDTNKNAADPSNNFVGIATTSPAVQSLHYLTTNSSIASLRNKRHHFVVTTTATGLTVTMDGTQVINATTTLPPNVLVGFTGTTSARNDLHKVMNVSITAGTQSAPTITALSPTTGPTAGGTTVTITGTNFTGASAVHFGATPATTYTVHSATSIDATAPPGSGTVDITVTTPAGTSPTSPADHYTYTAQNTIPSPLAGGWQLNGAALLVKNTTPQTLRLTPATNWKAGSAFWPAAVPGAGISATFDAFIGSGSGAEGLTFTLADASTTQPTALGAAGGGEGFAGIDGIAVSLDTNKNAADPSNNFVGIATTSPAVQSLHYLTTNSSIASLRNKRHHFVVTTTATGLTVTMDGTQVINATTTLPPNVLVGFTGTTSARNDLHKVMNVSITAGTQSAPTITALSPTTGPTAGGTTVTITGTNFTGASAVHFGATPATTYTVHSATSIDATAPPGSGTVDITVTTPAGTSPTSPADHYTYTAQNTIPSPLAGGWQLNGTSQLVTTATPPNLQLTPATNWQAGSAFWPLPVPGAGISAAFDAFIGSGSGADGLTFTLADASTTNPDALGDNGGGEGFAGIDGIAVSLDTWQNDADPSNNFVGIATASTPMQLLHYAETNSSIPALLDHTHHFVVTTTATGLTVTMDGSPILDHAGALPPYVLVGFTAATGGFSDVHQIQNITITAGPPLPVPVVTAVSPSSGPSTGGTAVTIAGTNFTGVSAVHFGATPATAYTVQSPTSIDATAPAGPLGPVDVTVTTSQGTSATSPGDQFTFTAPPAPTVTGVSPDSGSTAGGTPVTITGTAFTDASAVTFGATPATTFTVTSATSIAATAPAGSGTVDVTVTGPAGTSTTSANDHFTYVAAPPPPPPVPAVVSVDPMIGSPGSLVAVSGTGFTGATAVHFGATTATFTVNNDTSITATAPPGSGTVDVTVTTPGGTSTANDDDHFTFSAGPPPGSVPSPVAGGWQLNGSAQLVTTASPPNVQLTPATNWVAGSAFWPVPVPGAGVTAAFDAFIGPSAGADGLTFTLADASVTKADALGNNGGGEGFAGIAGIAVSLDTWQNDADPSSNFVGIATTSPAMQSLHYVTTNSSITPLVNSVHHFVVTTFATGLSVSMDGTQVLSYTTSLPPYVLLGFTSATGGFNDVHQIQNVTITAGPPPPVPTISSVNPNSGPTTGGTTVTITGTGLTSTSAVDFGGTAASDFLVQNDTTVIATAPAGKLGAVDVTATTAGGTTAKSTADKFTYTTPPAPTVTGVSPASGPSTGGTAVTITGTGLTGASAVNFGATNPAIFFTVNSPTTITATAPSATVTTVDVTITTPGGTSTSSAADKFTYTVPPAPTVTGLSPASGPNGTFVTITGTSFSGATAVHFGATATTTFTVSDPTTIFATAPSGSGAVDVTVTTPGGTSTTNAHDKYTYTVPSAPTVTALSPASGFQTTSVVITGTNFTGASAVHFGTAAAAAFTVNSSTSITATAPAGSSAVDVTVTTSGGASATGTADQFTYLAGPPPPTQIATYRADLGRTGYYPSETGVTAANAATLKLHWTATGGTSSFAQPIVVNNLVYWGDWSGFEHATDLNGNDVWSTDLGQTNDASCSPPTAGVSGTVTAAVMNGTPVVYVPGGDGDLYALNALTGAVIWKTNLGTPPAVYLWDSPVLFNGSIYMGVSSFGDCPLVQGQLVKLDATTGGIQHVANLVPDGCVGAGVWTSPTVDPTDGSVYVTTGTPNSCKNPGPNLAPSIVKLRATDLAIVSSWTVPTFEQQFGDEDFGGTPTLFTATINGVPRKLVGALNKNGLFYAWDRSDVAAGPVWQSTIADPSGSPRSIVSASWDGTYIYVGGGGAIINGTSCYGNISALDPATGAFVWRSCQTSFMTAGLTEVPGLLIEGVGAAGNVMFLNTANGATVMNYNTHSMVQGEVTVAGGIVYVPLANGNLVALGQ